jgi:hypothetical protein
MNAIARFCLVAALLISTAHHSPAPIQEENPTPAPTLKPKAKAPRAASKPKPSASAARARPTAAATPLPSKFDGTWTGTLPNLPFVGNVDFTLLVSANGTSVTENSANFGTNSFQANCDGVTMKWETGSSWTLTPNPDGQAGLVTCNNGGFFGVGAFSLSTVFRRTSTATVTQTSAPVVTNTSGPAPVAKAVPDRPGFVYNPFDPNSHILLDVRGKASGTKLIEPKSGKMFAVP